MSSPTTTHTTTLFLSASFSFPCPPNMACVNPVDVGPWGGTGGGFWEVNGNIRKIVIRYGDVVDSLTITYIKNEQQEESIRFGGPGGDNEYEAVLADDGEFLVTIAGVVNNSQLVEVVASLTFVTNLRTIGPFGGSGGTPFSLPVINGKSAGLFGRAGNFLDAIGITLVPVGQVAIELGPWGGVGGTPWSWNGEVRSFRVEYDEEVIVSITFNVAAGNFDGRGGKQTFSELVTLETGEYLLSIRGATGKHENAANVLQTISFVTNRRVYGPYARAGARAIFFDAPVINGKIVGFSGRQGAWVDAIAFGVAPVPE